MDLEQIYFVSGIVAAMAVVASLVYVGVQLRQNTLTVRVAAGQAHVDAYDSLLSRLTESADMTEVWVRAATDAGVLDTAERTRVYAFIGVMFRNFEGAYIQWRAGVLDEWFWQGIRRSMADQYAHDAVCAFWSVRRHWFSDEFGTWFDANVVEAQNNLESVD